MSWSDYFDQKDRNAYEESYHKGYRESGLKIAIRMLEYDEPIDLIADVTELTYEKVFELSERTPRKRKHKNTNTRPTTQQNVSEVGLIALPRAHSSVFTNA